MLEHVCHFCRSYRVEFKQAFSERLKSRLSKKHVLIAVITLFITGLVVTAVLVGIRIYTDSNLEVQKVRLLHESRPPLVSPVPGQK